MLVAFLRFLRSYESEVTGFARGQVVLYGNCFSIWRRIVVVPCLRLKKSCSMFLRDVQFSTDEHNSFARCFCFGDAPSFCFVQNDFGQYLQLHES